MLDPRPCPSRRRSDDANFRRRKPRARRKPRGTVDAHRAERRRSEPLGRFAPLSRKHGRPARLGVEFRAMGRTKFSLYVAAPDLPRLAQFVAATFDLTAQLSPDSTA